jgi:hypothetical protein
VYSGPVRCGGFYRRDNAEYLGGAKIYEGEWKEDKYHGKGMLFLQEGAKRCEGVFENG